ncbi:MAG: glycine cleavage system aminomethyltransferase GcvT [Candidatus Acididesulfobacter diazotrophicus]|jgi:aminomethyltransferase|uniref:aminomethyltransferase n=1 Tax=Candidatus Acididesulfobacter diazotrophicus TaxID=2597226 RepID=A0A519BPM5_9DELT|nr:MAG: glycine cleavage system aminomethyltransferase GcvT [Candidatus Acididesulfobacter diazotrophicus]
MNNKNVNINENENKNKKTPLYDKHLALGAKIVSFAGFSMPLYYKSIIDEHLNVRNHSGLFDISHMGEIIVKGKDAGLFLDFVLTADVSSIFPNTIAYSLILNENGGVIDDLTVYKFSNESYMIVANAANTKKDFAWIHTQMINLQKSKLQDQSKFQDLTVENYSDKIGLLSVQGPKSRNIIYPLAEDISDNYDKSKNNFCNIFNFQYNIKPFKELSHFEFSCIKFKEINIEAVISRSGYTGEFGFEIFVSADDINKLWDYILDNKELSNLTPIGLGARDTLRFEAALPLYGHELDETINPYDAGLEKYLSKNKDFIGKEALEKIKNKEKKLIFFKLAGKQIPRHMQKILDENLKPIGCVASGTYSPLNKMPIGSAYISDSNVIPSSLKNFYIDIRGNFEKAEVVNPPFHKMKK